VKRFLSYWWFELALAGSGVFVLMQLVPYRVDNPPDHYTFFGLHKESKLSPAEFQELIDGLEKTIAADPPAGGG